MLLPQAQEFKGTGVTAAVAGHLTIGNFELKGSIDQGSLTVCLKLVRVKLNLPGLFQVQQGDAEAVHEAVAVGQPAVVVSW